MFFRKRKVDVSIDTLKLRVRMVNTLLNKGFSWEDIDRGLGFSKSWYKFTNWQIESHRKLFR